MEIDVVELYNALYAISFVAVTIIAPIVALVIVTNKMNEKREQQRLEQEGQRLKQERDSKQRLEAIHRDAMYIKGQELETRAIDIISRDCSGALAVYHNVYAKRYIRSGLYSITEIDVIALFESYIACVECKNWTGTITMDGNNKPILVKDNKFVEIQMPWEQNNYHMKALRQAIPTTPIVNIVVLGDNCNLGEDILIPMGVQVVHLNELSRLLDSLDKIFIKKYGRLNMGDICSKLDALDCGITYTQKLNHILSQRKNSIELN